MDILKDSSIVTIAIIVSNVLAYIFHIYAGRVLGPLDYGIFGALMALFSIIALPAAAISSGIAKFTAKFNNKKEYNKIGFLRKIISKKVWLYSIIVFILIVLSSKYISNYLKITSVVPIIIVGFTLIFAMVLPVNRGILQGMKKFRTYSWNNILESVARLILFIILFLIGLKVNGAILAYGLAYFVAFVGIFPFIKEIKTKEEVDIEIKPVYKFIMLVLLVNIILQLMINAPTLFIKHYLSPEFAGYWTAALTIARITLFVTGGIAFVMFPEIAEKENHEDKKRVFRKALILTLLLSIGIALIFFITPELLITTLYGKAFIPAVIILKWMGVVMIGFGVLQLWLNYWMASRT